MKKMFTNLRWGLLACSLFSGITAYSQDPCSTDPCTANDLQVDSVFLADAEGNLLLNADDYECLTGTPTEVYLVINFKGNTVTPRYSLLTYFDVYVDGYPPQHKEICYKPAGGILNNDYHLLPVPVTWLCGSEMQLRNMYMSWQTGSGDDCKCGGSKCARYAGPIIVNGPVIANFDAIGECLSYDPYETWKFTSTTSGGAPPYTYLWNLGNSAAYSVKSGSLTSSEIVVQFNQAIADLDVSLTVTDNRAVNPRMDEETKTITVNSCCDLKLTEMAKDTLVECDGSGNSDDLAAWLENHGGARANDRKGSSLSWDDNYDPALWVGDNCNDKKIKHVTVVFSVTDLCGNSLTTQGVFTIRDNTPPEIDNTTKKDLTLDCDGTTDPDGAIAVWLGNHAGAVASDACSTVTWSHNYAGLSDLCGATGNATVIFTATDACSNSTTTSATVTIRDITPPEIDNSAKKDLTLDCDGTTDPGGAIALWLGNHAGAVASDACSTVTWNHNYTGLSDLCGATGTATVIFTATDACSHSSTTTATVTIRDITSPVVSGTLSDVTVEGCDITAAPPAATTITGLEALKGNLTVSDACSPHGFLALTHQDQTGGSCPMVITRTYTVTDECGNSVTTSHSIYVDDTTPPTFTRPADFTIYLDSSCEYDAGISVTGDVTDEADNCGVGQAVFKDAVHKTDPCHVVITRTWSLSDLCGNAAADQVQTILVIDTIAPVLDTHEVCIFLSKLGLWSMTDFEVKQLVQGTTDNCTDSDHLRFTVTPRAFGCYDVGKDVHVKVTVADLCGNSTTDFAKIWVRDTIRPVALCKDITVYLDKFKQAFIVPGDVNPGNDRESVPEWAKTFNDLEGGSYDNCGVEKMFLSKQHFTSADVGNNNVILSAYDPSGNLGVCTAVVTVIDTIPSVLEPISNLVITLPAGICSTRITYPEIKVKASGPVKLERIAGLGADGIFPLGTTVETWKATDQWGTVSYASFTVTVKSVNAAPVLDTVNDITVNEDTAPFEIPLSGIGFGNDCLSQQIISLEVSNSKESLLMLTSEYVNGAATGKLLVTLMPGESGEAVITLKLKDSGGTDGDGVDTTVKSFKITVNAVNDPPQVNPIPDQTVIIPGSLSVNVASAFIDDDEGDLLTYSVTRSDGSSLPAWMTFSGATGLLTGIPEAPDQGVTEIKVVATDKAGAKAQDIFLVLVTSPVSANLEVTAIKGTTPLTGGFDVTLLVKNGSVYDQVLKAPFCASGTCTFYNLPAGNYLALAKVTDVSMNPGLMNTWYESAASVSGAAGIEINAPGTKSVRITMISSPVVAGDYKIMGAVVRKTGTPDLIEQGKDPVSSPASGISMLLKQNGAVIATVLTGTDGKYSFEGLPAGEYEVWVDIPGYTQDITQNVIMNAANPVQTNVNFTIWTVEGGTHIISSVIQTENPFESVLYPNPTTGLVNVDITWNGIRRVDISVYNILGVLVLRNQYRTGDQITFNMSGNASGIYLVKINAEGITLLKELILNRK